MEISCYEDLVLRPDQDISSVFLMEKVMSALHLICVESEQKYGMVNIGLGFPQYNKEKKSLGQIIRLFSHDSSILHNLSSDIRLQRLEDYIQKGEICPIPTTLRGYVQYQRMQFKENKDRLIRRFAKRHHMDIKLAENKYQECKKPVINLPYVTLTSSSSKKRFRLYIKESSLTENSSPLVFSSYGLTKSGVLPYF